MTSPNPSPFTSPAAATEKPKAEANRWPPAPRRDRIAEPGARLSPIGRPGGHRRGPARGPEEHERPPLIEHEAVIEARGADDDVGVAVVVHVTRPGHRVPELLGELVSQDLP